MPSLGEHLRVHRDAIRDEWARRVKDRIPAAEDKRGPALLDHVPNLIEAFADFLERREASAGEVLGLARVHASHRFAQDYDLRDIAGEYAILRDVLFEFAARSPDVPPDGLPTMSAVHAMNHEMDDVVYEAIRHYVAERDRSRELFLGMLTHDLRNPLDAARLSLSMLARRGNLPDAERNILETARSNLTTMARLVDDLADLMRARLGKGVPVARDAVDVGALVRKVVADFRVAHEGHRLDLDVADDLWAFADRTRMTQVIMNLLWNAVKHGSDPIGVSARADGDLVVIEVRNPGVIPEPILEGLFDPFTGGRGVGLGLGLYIVCEIMQAHGGSVKVTSDEDGTWFRVALPRALPSEAVS